MTKADNKCGPKLSGENWFKKNHNRIDSWFKRKNKKKELQVWLGTAGIMA